MDTKTAILDVAQGLIQTRGVNGMSYDDISAAVGIRKPSIHHHFATKADLVAALIERYSALFLERVDGIVAGGGTGLEQLQAFVGLFEETLRKEHGKAVCLCGMLASELATLDAPAAAGVQRFYRKSTKSLAGILDTGARDGTLGVPGDPARLADLIFSLLEGASMTSRVSGGIRRFRATTDELYELLGVA